MGHLKNSMDEEQHKKHRIGWFAIFILVFLALVCDLLGLIPFVKDVLGTIFWICASIYFWMIGMGIFNGRKLAVMMVSWVASLIPVIQEIPFELVLGGYCNHNHEPY
jgi:pheromone shutdown protein TraB